MTFTKDTSGPCRLTIRGTHYHTVRVITVQNVDSTSSEVLSNLRRENAGNGTVSPSSSAKWAALAWEGDLNVQVLPILDLPRSKLDRDPGQSAQKIVQSRRQRVRLQVNEFQGGRMPEPLDVDVCRMK